MFTILNAVEPVDRIMGMDAQLFYSTVIMFGNVVLLVGILSWLLYKPVRNFLDNRIKRIEASISDATADQRKAQELKQSYERKIVEIEKEKTEIIAVATQRAKEIEASIVSEAKEEATRLKNAAMREIEANKEKAAREMREQIIDISALLAGKYVEESINQEMQIRLLDKAIDDLGDATWLN